MRCIPAGTLQAGSLLYELDPDCLRCIIRMLAPKHACNLAQTCTHFRTLVLEVRLSSQTFVDA